LNNITADTPLVSIVLPSYKRAYVLPDAINSILNQTYTNFELIIVDDNSPDNTAEVIKSFNDPRIQYVKNESNLKLPRTLNKGFSLAQGEYLTWTSDDNIFEPTAIEKMVAALQASQCEFVYADYYLFSDTDANSKPLNPQHSQLPFPIQLEKSNDIGACFMYTRRVYEEIGEYDPELFLVEDYDYFIRIEKKFKMQHIPSPLYYFRRDDNTLYCSRFCEVKASDFLVRYKNKLLDDNAVLDSMIALITQDMKGLKNPLLSSSYLLVHKLSFKLTQLQKKFTFWFLKNSLKKKVKPLLHNYSKGQVTFEITRNNIKDLLQSYGTIEYRS
jgi:glycosyltransferase involved in cell wall biosynthesis